MCGTLTKVSAVRFPVMAARLATALATASVASSTFLEVGMLGARAPAGHRWQASDYGANFSTWSPALRPSKAALQAVWCYSKDAEQPGNAGRLYKMSPVVLNKMHRQQHMIACLLCEQDWQCRGDWAATCYDKHQNTMSACAAVMHQRSAHYIRRLQLPCSSAPHKMVAVGM